MRTAGAMPVHPVLFAVAYIATLFANSTATVEVLPRPMVIAAGVALVVQLLLTIVTRDRGLGAYAALAALLVLVGLPQVSMMLAGVPLAVVVGGIIFRRVVPRIPWRRGTEFLNLVMAGILIATLISAGMAGALTSPAGPVTGTSVDAATGPDVYLLLLDGYPRSDTLETDFGYDNEPFLTEMEGLGFHVSREARSNYNATILTLTSMVNGRQLHDLPSLVNPTATDRLSQSRLLERAINQGSMLEAFRSLGYEIVTVPSPFSNVTLWSADRVLGDGTITEFEASVLQIGPIVHVAPAIQRTWIAGALRVRVATALGRTIDLATERGRPPKLVLTHVMSPHNPVLFDADGAPREGPDCFPERCSIFDLGWDDGPGVDPSMAGQVEHLNRLVSDTVERILAASQAPPVIVVFSDHGHRQTETDRVEMSRSLLMTLTPGKPNLIPDDATPVNLLARILNAYHGTSLGFASEESYLTDLFGSSMQTMVRLD